MQRACRAKLVPRLRRGYTTINNGDTTHFGFKEIPKDKKETLVGEVFHNVANKYDLMNDFMSAGIHRYWKYEMVRKLSPQLHTSILDVAGGTGDIAFRMIESLKDQAKNYNYNLINEAKETKVTVCDINSSMLQVGKERAKNLGYLNLGANSLNADKNFGGIHLDFVEGNAEKLPFEDNSFDAYTIAFGIRNVTNIEAAISEAYRVLKKGGRFLCLEFSQVENTALRQIYDTYSFNVIPHLGQAVAGDFNSYQYLVESIRKFPDQETFKSMIQQHNFKYVSYENMTFGVVAMHTGFKL